MRIPGYGPILCRTLGLAIALLAAATQLSAQAPAPTGTPEPTPTPYPAPNAAELAPIPAGMTLETLDSIPTRQAVTKAPVLLLIAPRVSDQFYESYPKAASTLDQLMVGHLAVAKPGQVRFNTVGWFTREVPYRDHTDRDLSGTQPEEVLVRDARSLQADLLAMPALEGTPEAGTFSYTLLDLASGKRVTGSQAYRDGQIAPAVTAMVLDLGKLAGWTQNQMQSAAMLESMVDSKAWTALATASPDDYQKRIEEVITDQTAEAAALMLGMKNDSKWTVDRINQAIKRQPWDSRLMLAKAQSLLRIQGRSKAALILLRALSRIDPGTYIIMENVSLACAGAYSSPTGEAPEITKGMLAIAADADEFMRSTKESWGAAYIAGNTYRNLGASVRGSRTADLTPQANFRAMAAWQMRSMQYFESCRGTLGDKSSHLFQLMAQVAREIPNGPSMNELVELSYKANPRDPRAALTRAYYNSVGWGNPADYLRLNRELIRRHKGDPLVESMILAGIVRDLYRMRGFYKQNSWDVVRTQPELIMICLDLLKSGYSKKPVPIAPKEYYLLLIATGENQDAEAAQSLILGNKLEICALDYVGMMDHYKMPIFDNPTILSLAWKQIAVTIRENGYTEQNRHHMSLTRKSLCDSMIKAGRTEELLALLDELISLVPNDVDNRLQYAQVASTAGLKVKEGLTHARKVLEIKPGDTRATVLVTRLEGRAK